MTTERKLIGVYLDKDHDQKLDRIAAAMSRELGMPVSRSAAVARLIAAFFLPDGPSQRIISAEKEDA